MKKAIHFLGVFMIYIMTSSFGLVEYSAMRPHTYFVGIDSTKQLKQPLAKKEFNQVQKKDEVTCDLQMGEMTSSEKHLGSPRGMSQSE